MGFGTQKQLGNPKCQQNLECQHIKIQPQSVGVSRSVPQEIRQQFKARGRGRGKGEGKGRGRGQAAGPEKRGGGGGDKAFTKRLRGWLIGLSFLGLASKSVCFVCFFDVWIWL